MEAPVPKKKREGINFSSSLKHDVWHPATDGASNEVWHFDALSDDGTEAVGIRFHDNVPGGGSESVRAVTFLYFSGGKVIYRGMARAAADNFAASAEEPLCTIGESGFDFSRAEYGSGFFVKVKLELSGGRYIESHFEWLSIEADLAADPGPFSRDCHHWNIVAPRSDVTGKITMFNKHGSAEEIRHFRGTGHHSHILDRRPHVETAKHWHWGRVHYADSTAAFSVYRDAANPGPNACLIIIRDGEMQILPAEYSEHGGFRNKFGIRYTAGFRLESPEAVLDVKPIALMDGDIGCLRFLSAMSLVLNGSEEHSRPGLTELSIPVSGRSRFAEWFGKLRPGRNGKNSLFS